MTAAQAKHPVPRIAMQSELTIFRAAKVEQELLAQLASATAMDVDLSGVKEIDLSGIELLIALKHRNKPVNFFNPSKAVQHALQRLELPDLLELKKHSPNRLHN